MFGCCLGFRLFSRAHLKVGAVELGALAKRDASGYSWVLCVGGL